MAGNSRFGNGTWRLGLSILGGSLVVLSFAPFEMFYLSWIALVPILWAVRGTGHKGHFFLGLVAGTVANAGTFWWICPMLMDFGHMGFFASGLLTMLLVVYQGLVFALWLWLLSYVRKWVRLSNWILVPLVFIVAEYSVWFIFPWYYANSQAAWVPMIQVCELGGVGLLDFLLAMINGALFDSLVAWRLGRKKAWVGSVIAFFVLVVIIVYGFVRIAQVDSQVARAETLRIGLVEADVGIWEKEDPRKIEDNLVRHQRMSTSVAHEGAELIVWPETAYWAPVTFATQKGSDSVSGYGHIPRDVTWIPPSSSVAPRHATEDRNEAVPIKDRTSPQRGFSTYLLFGSLTTRPNPESRSISHPGVDFLNSAILLDPNGRVLGIYDKVYRLMFGEYIPLGESFPFLYKWLPESAGVSAGSDVHVLQMGKYKLGVMICYEDILAAFTRRIAAQRPNVLINLTNDAWFGKTPEPYLHLSLAVLRTVESRLALVRATNTGISCFVDPSGRVLEHTSLEKAETLIRDVPMMNGVTPYQVLGDWPLWTSLFVLIVLLVRAGFTTTRSRQQSDVVNGAS